MKEKDIRLYRSPNIYNSMYTDGYAKLASAIITSGKKENDEVFLNGDWIKILEHMCQLDQVIHNGSNQLT